MSKHGTWGRRATSAWRLAHEGTLEDRSAKLRPGREERQDAPGKGTGEQVERRKSLPANCSSSPKRSAELRPRRGASNGALDNRSAELRPRGEEQANAPWSMGSAKLHPGGGGGGWPMRGLGTDHVISGPMRGLKKTASDGTNRQTSGHCDSMTESTKWGRFSENCVGA